MQGLDNGLTWFDNVRVSRSSLLHDDMGHFAEDGSFVLGAGNARSRFLRAMSRIVPGRLCVASAAQGASRASLYIALRYGQQWLTTPPGSTTCRSSNTAATSVRCSRHWPAPMR